VHIGYISSAAQHRLILTGRVSGMNDNNSARILDVSASIRLWRLEGPCEVSCVDLGRNELREMRQAEGRYRTATQTPFSYNQTISFLYLN